MSTKTLLSDDLWLELNRLAKSHKRIRAAISYVTAQHLSFHEGDLLICDASDEAIKGGLTSAGLLRAFFDEGAEIYSYDGLHAKVAIIDDLAVVGSANLSENSGVGTCEASLLTDDAQVVALIQGFLEKVKEESTLVTAKFLERIEGLPVARRTAIARKSSRKIDVGRSRVWLIATRSLSEQIVDAEAEYEEVGTETAEELIRQDGYEVRSIRWSGKSRFRSDAKPGDLVVEVFTEKRGSRKFIQVFPAAPILHRQDHGNWTRFYLEVPPEQDYYLWRDIKTNFENLGVTNISPNSTRELTGKALGILQMME